MGLRETVEFLRERDEVMVLATVTLVLTSRRFRSAGGIVVQLPVVSSQHCWNRIAVFGSETLTAVGVPSIPKRRYC